MATILVRYGFKMAAKIQKLRIRIITRIAIAKQ
jgi:hypothetical protein